MPPVFYRSIITINPGWHPRQTTAHFNISVPACGLYEQLPACPRKGNPKSTGFSIMPGRCEPEVTLECWSVRPKQSLRSPWILPLRWTKHSCSWHQSCLCTVSRSLYVLQSKITNRADENDGIENIYDQCI